MGHTCLFWNRTSYLCVGTQIRHFNILLIILVMLEWKMDLSRDFHDVRLKHCLSWLLWAAACSEPLYFISQSALWGCAFYLFSSLFPLLMTNFTCRGQAGSMCTQGSPNSWQWFIHEFDLFRILSLPRAICYVKCGHAHLWLWSGIIFLRHTHNQHTHILVWNKGHLITGRFSF